MTNAFKSIKQGLTEAIAHSKTKDTETTGVKLCQPHAGNVADLTNPSREGYRLEAASQLSSAQHVMEAFSGK
jgi:hypothetical protein